MSHNEKNENRENSSIEKKTVGLKRSHPEAASYLDRFSKFIYKGLKGGVVASLFTSYKSGKVKYSSGGGKNKFLSETRTAVASAFDDGYVSAAIKKLAQTLFSVRLKVYGTFLLTFASYAFLFGLLENFVFGEAKQIFQMLFGLILAVSSVSLLFSEETLAYAIDNSAFGASLKAVSGVAASGVKTKSAEGRGRVSYGFIAGVVAGGLSYFVSPLKILLFILALVLLWIIIEKPEFGMVALSFLFPFVSARFAAALIVAVAVSYFVKLVRRKRVAYFETLDASVFGILLVILLGGIVAVSPNALGQALNYVVLMLVYFLTVGLMKTKAWLDRMTVAAVFGLCIPCVLYFIARVGDMTVGGVGAAFAEMLGGTIAAELISGDKAVVSAVSVVAIPIVISFFMRPAFKVARGYSAMALLFFILPVIFDSSVYSALAVCISVLLLLLMYSRNSVYILFSLIITIPVAGLLFPVLASRGEAALTQGLFRFAESRTDIWKSVVQSLSGFLFGGVGFGKESFSAASTFLSGTSSETVPHTYNTYLQIWVETGVFGLIVFLVFAWLIISAAFTAFAHIDKARKSAALRIKGVRINIPESLSQFASEERRADSRLSVNQYCVSRRMGIAAPLCSVIGMFVYGFFDYIWYDEKVFLLFWIAAGLCGAYCAHAVKEIEDIESSYQYKDDKFHKFEKDIF